MCDDCLLTEGARRCGENQQCATCGFNPDVAAKRKAAIRANRKPEPPKPPRTVNLDDVLSVVKERLECAEKRLDEEIRNGEAQDIAYWRGRVDEARSIRGALEQTGGDGNADDA